MIRLPTSVAALMEAMLPTGGRRKGFFDQAESARDASDVQCPPHLLKLEIMASESGSLLFGGDIFNITDQPSRQF